MASLRINVMMVVLISFLLGACSDKNEWQSPHPQTNLERWVVHAGGHIHDKDYTNSLEALNASNKAGMQLVEIDFEWTRDGEVVLLHDWRDAMQNMFAKPPGQKTLAEFKALKTPSGLTQITAKELFAWLDKHPDIFIVTDMKLNALKTLRWIQENYPSYAERFIPQIYYFDQYEPVRRLGYYRVIFTLYRVDKKPDKDILNFCKTHSVWAVTMPEDRVFRGTLVKDLSQLHIPVYAHIVNNSEQIKTLLQSGVFGVYTDRTDLQNLKSISRN